MNNATKKQLAAQAAELAHWLNDLRDCLGLDPIQRHEKARQRRYTPEVERFGTTMACPWENSRTPRRGGHF